MSLFVVRKTAPLSARNVGISTLSKNKKQRNPLILLDSAVFLLSVTLGLTFYLDVIMDIIISILAGIAIAIEINEKQRTTPIGIIAIIVQVVSIAEILIYMNNYNVVPLYITAGILVLLGVMQFIKNRINLMASYCLWVICIAVMIEYIPLFLIGC